MKMKMVCALRILLGVAGWIYFVTPVSGATSVVRVLDTVVDSGKAGTILVELEAQGGENAVGFTLNFDPARLTFNSAVLGNGASGSALNVNSLQASAGRVGIALAKSAGDRFSAGKVELVRLSFNAGTFTGSTTISFGDTPVFREISDVLSSPLSASFVTGNITINTPPVASEQTVVTDEDLSKPITLGVVDPDAQTFTFTVVTPPVLGVLQGTPPQLTYVPNLNANGTDFFTFKVNDGIVDSAAARVNITVNAINDIPVAVAQTVTTEEDLAKAIVLAATDVDSTALTFSIVTQPAKGVLSGTPPNVVYTPNLNQNGTDTFSFKANDGLIDSAVVVVNVTINAVNDAPVAVGDSFAVDEDGVLTISAPGVLGNDTDPEATVLKAIVVAQPINGTVVLNEDGSFAFVPSLNFHGTDSFSYKVSDGVLESGPVTVIVTVNAVNDAPVIGPLVDQTVQEGVVMNVPIPAADVDSIAEGLAFTLEAGAPEGAVIDSVTGIFSWTPAESQGPGVYTIGVRVTDNGTPKRDAVASFKVTVSEFGLAPVFGTIAPQSVNEGQELKVTLLATDADLPAETLTFSLASDGPPGATIDPVTGVFSWTPGEQDGPLTHQIAVQVSDSSTPPLKAIQTVVIDVKEVNVAPVLSSIQPQIASEGLLLQVPMVAADTDFPLNTLTFSLGPDAPQGMVIDPSTGVLSWTPNETQGGTAPVITVLVRDNGVPVLEASQSFTVTVAEVNSPPALTLSPTHQVLEGNTLTFTATVVDPDIPANNFVFSLGPGSPGGSIINPTTGVFTWTPSEGQGPDSAQVTIVVTDNGTPALSVSRPVIIDVSEVNVAPVIAPVSTIFASEQVPVQFTASATDSDIPANGISWSLGTGAPSGATINPSTGVFTWTPSESQGPDTFNITLVATDNGSPARTSSQVVTISVSETNQRPTLSGLIARTVVEGETLSFTAVASDSDVPANAISFNLGPGAPLGASIGSTSGLFTWTPSETQGPGVFSIVIEVTDSGLPSFADVQTFSVTVVESNSPPVVASIGNQTVNEGVLLSLPVVVTDSDVPPTPVTFSLGAGAPAGATINPTTGVFSWTPTEAQGPGQFQVEVVVTESPAVVVRQSFSVTVNEVNQLPVMGPIADIPVVEGNELVFTGTATDADLPANTLRFSLGTGAPAGVALDAATGRLTWTPTEAQGPATYNLTLQVTDGTASAQQAFRINVTESNSPPAFGTIAPVTVNEGTLASVTVSATDPDQPANTITYSLGTGSPAGAAINGATGLFTWTPTEAQGPATNSVTIIATDNGNPSRSTNVVLVVRVAELNVGPVLGPITNRTVLAGSPVAFSVTATDVDLPLNNLTYALGPGAAAGAQINATTGAFSWTPAATSPASTNSFTVVVNDNGTPNLSTNQTFAVIVLPLNTAPTIPAIADQTAVEGAAFSLPIVARDTDVPANRLSFALLGTVPAGAVIDPGTGVFNWTPTEQQGPSTNRITVQVSDNVIPPLTATNSFLITVTETNAPPVIAPVVVPPGEELRLITFTVGALDPDFPTNRIRFTLEGAPAGATLDAVTGVFAWTPTEAQGPGTNTVTIVATDDGVPNQIARLPVPIVVTETNSVPQLTAIPVQNVVEGATVSFTAVANDPDLPGNVLTFSLGTNAPPNAVIDPVTGVFTWPTTEANGPGTNIVTVRVTDNGVPSMRAVRDVQIVVGESNQAPVLTAVPNQIASIQSPLTIRLAATDADRPTNRLTFSLGAGAPLGAVVDPVTGVFTWTPAAGQGGTTNTITAVVTDSGTPPLSDSKTFTVVVRATVNLPPTITTISNQQTRENTPTSPILFTLADPDTPVTNYVVRATSSNTNVVLNSGIVIAGEGTNKTVTITPVLNRTGASTITITAEENAGGRATTSFELTVNAVAPSISKQPEAQRVTLGGQASFSVTAAGTQPLAYQWSFNNTPIPNATNSVFVIAKVESTNEGEYSVRVTNPAGNAPSATVRLDVEIPLRITKQPLSQTVLAGANVTLVATANGRGQLSYQWHVNGAPITGANQPSLVLQNVEAALSGDYTVVVSNAAGSVTSDVAKLVVNTAVGITTQPEPVAAVNGQDVSFRVVAAGTPPLAFQWQFNGVDLPGANEAVLTLPAVTPDRQGEYKVVISNVGGSVSSQPAALTVSVPPTITVQPAPLKVVAGEPAAFSVTVSGSEPITYQWTRNGANLPLATGPQLSIPVTTAADEGQYAVIVTNPAGSQTSAAAALTVISKVAITLQPQPQTVVAGTTATFQVIATGSAPLEYQWRLNGVDIPNANSATLAIPNVQPSNAGSYEVVVRNEAGPVVSTPAILTVNVPVRILTEPQDIRTTNTASVVFAVEATGTPQLTYQWRFNGANIGGQTGPTLALNNVSPAQSGAYSVLIQNVAGTVTSRNAILTVLVPPTVTTQPQPQTVGLGVTARFSVTAAGDGPLVYQWQLNGISLTGATQPTLDVVADEPGDAGNYMVVITGPGGTVTSAAAGLTLILPPISLGTTPDAAPPIEIPEGSFDGGSNEGGVNQPARRAVAPRQGEERWFSWKAPASGVVTFTTAGSTFDTEIAIYTGPRDNLTLIVRDDDGGGFFSSQVRFNAVQGTTYHINVRGFEGASGRIVVSFKLNTGVAGTLPEIAKAPEDVTVAVGGDATFTVEARGSALTYQWLANGVVIPNQTQATLVVRNVQEADAVKYSVRITSGPAANGLIVESFPAALQIGPPNTVSVDKFRSAPRLGGVGVQLAGLGSEPGKTAGGSVARGYSGAQVFNTFGATKEQGEPSHADEIGGASQWFTYQAPDDGVLRVSTEGSSFDTVLAVYSGTGTDFASLRLLGFDNNSGSDGKTSVTAVNVSSNVVYFVAVDGVKGATGKVNLNYGFGALPTIAQGPVNQTVAAGVNVTFLVAVTNRLASRTTAIPPVTYQWLRDGLKITGATTNSYRITNVQPADSAEYAVIVSSFVGAVTSSVARLTINVPISFSLQPAGRSVKVGETISLVASASGTPTILYQWRKDGVDIAGQTAPVLLLNNVQPVAAGSYTVVARNAAGPQESAPAVISVAEGARIVTQPQTQSVSLNQNATFSVVASGTAPLTYQWRKNGVNIPNATAATLTLNNVRASDVGEYSVQVSNAAGAVASQSATLNIRVPLTLTSVPRSQNVNVGSSAVLSVAASGTGPFTYEWRQNGVPIPAGPNAPNLSLLNVQAAQAGQYTVRVTSGGESVISDPPAVISVSDAPVIVQDPQPLRAFTQNNVRLSVVATGTGPLQYQWLFNGSPIAGQTTADLDLLNLRLSDSGVYTVIVSNSAGSVQSNPAPLTVLQVVSDVQINNNQFQFRLTVPEGLRLQIEVSEDLQAWTLFKGPYNSGTIAIDDPEFLLLDSKFYRIITAP